MLASRRNLLLGTVGAAAFMSMGQLSSCSTANGGTVDPAVIDIITKIISGTCQIIPVVATLVDVVVAVFPAAAGVATITDAVAQNIANYICNLFKTSGVENHKPGAGLYKAKVNGKDITLHGYIVQSGALVYF